VSIEKQRGVFDYNSFFYLAVSFNCMNQSILLSEINFYRIQVKAEQWFESCYIDKIQAVDVKYSITIVKPTKTGLL
jgi:hypothetical protein